MIRNRKIGAALAVAAIAGGGAGAAAVAMTQHSDAHGGTTFVAAPVTPASNTASSSTKSVAQIAQDSTPGVVEVDASGTSSQSPFPGGSSSTSAEGTGWVYDAQGHIVTNEHVIDGASSVSVKFSDGSTAKATVVASDTSSDLAVLKVDVPSSKLKVLPVGDSSALAVGDGVVAIGNPYGLDGTVTTGIVSALDREISAPDGTPIEGAIQTDAAINHGNSGGPLFNLDGQVVGITSQIQSDSGVNDGIGFAISSNTVKSVVQQLLTTGKVAHPLLGVRIASTSNGGASVTSVESGSGAAKGGVKVGDVITAVDGTTVTSPEQLRALIDTHKPGDTLQLEVRRSGSTKTLTVTLGSRSA
jgi:putative serine protease PepD